MENSSSNNDSRPSRTDSSSTITPAVATSPTAPSSSPAAPSSEIKKAVDPESGVPAVEEKTAEEILAQVVETLPMRQLAPAFLG